jgi:hypothetical protein
MVDQGGVPISPAPARRPVVGVAGRDDGPLPPDISEKEIVEASNMEGPAFLKAAEI